MPKSSADVDSTDLIQLVTPMCTNASVTEDQSRRLLAMILDGLKALLQPTYPRRPTPSTRPAPELPKPTTLPVLP
jgi:hypothetical protein